MACTILVGIFIPNLPKIHKTTRTAKTMRANFKSAQHIKMNIPMIDVYYNYHRICQKPYCTGINR